MMQINWNALQAFDIGGAFNQGMQAGQQQRRERAIDDAYRGLIANPNDSGVVNALAQHAPREAYQISGQQRKAQTAQHQAGVRSRAVAGDPAAMQEFAGFDMDGFLKLDERSRKQFEQGVDTLGQLALMADTPEEWDDTVQKLAQGAPEFQQYVGRFDLRESVIAKAKLAKEFIAQNQPRYQVIPEGGTLVNTRDHAALAQVAGQNAPQGGPQPGTVEDGYRFRGGNPADPSSWEPVGDGPPPTSAAPAQANIMRQDEYQTFVRSMGKEAADRWLASQGIRVGNY